MNRAPAPPPEHMATSAPGTWLGGALAPQLLDAPDHPLQQLGRGAAVAERHQPAVGGHRVPAAGLIVPSMTKSPPSPSPQNPNASNCRMISKQKGS